MVLFLSNCYYCYFSLTGIEMYKRRDWCPGYNGLDCGSGYDSTSGSSSVYGLGL